MKKIVWSLFDSGNSSYKQAIDKYFDNEVENYSIGIDKLNKNSNFINLDLSDYKEIFGNNKLFNILDELPKPDIILASPPCESFSVASAMKGGNKFYVWNDGNMTPSTANRILSKNDTPFKSDVSKATFTRINGELCAFNSIRIINRYQPETWVIENPQSSKIWYYLEHNYNFVGIRNVAHYVAYDKEFPKKPTTFMSNKFLSLAKMPVGAKADIVIGSRGQGRKQIRDYNVRSNIPLSLIKDILEQVI
ncbi:DNA methyltransferase [Leuconostoc citreum]|uniref:DNA methyltransferase n=1 Tax=Leuconostoc citreum TaxID=33964 RepID=A0A5A5TX63_LEUCI|nr:DNA methyltransferase [Leuconostoc citreum]GDZ83061.1 DNA methyltransferase [Leuconostoc citreum]